MKAVIGLTAHFLVTNVTAFIMINKTRKELSDQKRQTCSG